MQEHGNARNVSTDSVSMKMSETDFKNLTRAIKDIGLAFGDEAVRQIAFDAAKPIFDASKSAVPVNTNAEYIKPKRHWADYRPGALDRSLKRWKTKKRFGPGALVGAKFGGRRSIANDGWYVHFAHDKHPVAGGKKTSKATPFMETAYRAGANAALNLMIKACQKILDRKW
jgi:HK97 gp10 family phage protein